MLAPFTCRTSAHPSLSAVFFCTAVEAVFATTTADATAAESFCF